MENITVQTLGEFTTQIENNFDKDNDVLFRGHEDSRWQLIPSIARGRRTRDPTDSEIFMLERFQRQSLPFLKVDLNTLTLWDWMAIAQHHGLPTRLLDWSLNPFAALWFVVKKHPKEGVTNGAVWILQPEDEDVATDEEMNSIECERYRVFRPKHITERITAQVAYFTVHKKLEETDFEPLEKSQQLKNRLVKIEIPANRFAHFRFHLNRFGVNSASVFPGLDGLCEYLRWTTFFLEDEGERDQDE
jgi:hypothetical protein